jgi:mono/diheme cytochrome c family protein
VVAYVKQFSTVFNGASAQPIVIPPRPPKTAAGIERGRALYIAQDCIGCHGSDGRKGGFLSDLKNYPVRIRDLSAPWTFHGGSDPNQIWLRLTTGLAGTNMRSYTYGVTPDQRWDLVSYVESLARVAPWQ